MSFVELAESPHAPGIHPVRIHYREFGRGRPLVFLHGGWGYGVYPFERQIEAFEGQFRVLIPDRSGYGSSTRVPSEMPTDFHQLAAQETIAFLDALGIERTVFWGHSDGAVIGAMLGMRAAERCESLILEAFHFFRNKPNSRSFFERFTANPEDLGEETRELLRQDHGDVHWQNVPRRNCGAWLRIADQVQQPDEDLYDGRLSELRVPTLFLHGHLDPRTEPGEMERVGNELPQAEMQFVHNGKHSPHSETDASQECNAIAGEFLQRPFELQKLKR
jgi:pimeloyl-ACP methyl ester carboxylesterase